MRHTKGPWKFKDDCKNPSMIESHEGYTIADLWKGAKSVEEFNANASLIAAAPELLQALKDCRRELGRFAGPLNDAANHAILDADAAIARAEAQ